MPERPKRRELRWKTLGSGWDTFIILRGIVGESTKNPSGARIIGIVTAVNRNDDRAWQALAACDMAELRADFFDPDRIAVEARAFREECRRRLGRVPETILTIRLRRDGGAWPDDQAAGRERIWQSLSAEEKDPFCDWFDIEAEEYPSLSPSLRAKLSEGGMRLLLSHHNMAGSYTPEGLRGLLESMSAHRPAGIKVAVTCADRKELLELLAFAREVAAATPNGCVLSMGPAGRPSRVLAPLLGCPLTYGYLSGESVAPGQLSTRSLGGFFGTLPSGGLDGLTDARLADWAEARIPGEEIAH